MHNNTARSARDTLAGLDRCAELALRSGLEPPRVSVGCLRTLHDAAAGEAVARRDHAAALREVRDALVVVRDALGALAAAVGAGAA